MKLPVKTNPIRWFRKRLSHKLSHFDIESMKKTIRENGLALLVIIIGWEIVEGYGGEVRALDFLDDCSTTAIVEKIQRD